MFEQEIVKKTVCMWCHSHCPVGVHIKNGELDRVEEFKGHRHASFYRQVVRGCPRAKVAREWFYHPDRLNFPLKRIGERGEAKWKRISWEQALDEIAAKFLKIREEFGPEAVATNSGTYRTHDEYRVRFMNLFGSPNHIGQGHICYGPSNMIGAALVGWAINYVGVRPQAKCILIAGFNPEQSGRALWLNIVEAQRNGAKLIVIDPRRIVPAEKANLWLQLRPGTDTALYMAMINVIIEEKLYDREFVEKWCFGFDRLVERVKEYPPEKAAGITWVAEDLIKEAARTFVTDRPALCYNMMGVEHLANCIEALHALTLLPIITGNVDVKGGNLIRYPHPKYMSEFEIELNDELSVGQKAKSIGQEQFKFNSWPAYEMILENWKNAGVKPFAKSHNVFAHNPSVYRAMITSKPYPVRAMITVSSNPMITQANTKLVYRALRSLDLYVVMDFWMTPSAELCDYVLPAASWLERPHIHTQTDITSRVEAGVAAMPHQVEGKYDRRRDYDFLRA